MRNKGTTYFNNFKTMLKKSAPFVVHVIQNLQRKGIRAYENDDKKFDVITEFGTKYEVKVDGNAFIYGRTGVEISSWGKDAGIMSTEAHYYIIYYPILNFILTVRTDAIRILMYRYVHQSFPCGDGKNTWMALWSCKLFFEQLELISKEFGFKFQLLRLEDEYMSHYDDRGIYDYLVNKYRTLKNNSSHQLRVRNNSDLQRFYRFVDEQITEQNLWPKNFKITHKKSFEYERYN